jgi:hypothetical protein
MMIVSGRLRSAKVLRVQGVVAAAGVGQCARRDHGDGQNKGKETATHKQLPLSVNGPPAETRWF